MLYGYNPTLDGPIPLGDFDLVAGEIVTRLPGGVVVRTPIPGWAAMKAKDAVATTNKPPDRPTTKN